MICKNCQKEIKDTAKFCNFCGMKVKNQDTQNPRTFKEIVLNLFDLRAKKNFIESLVLYVIGVITIIPIYFVIPINDDIGIYIQNTIIGLLFAGIISFFKGVKRPYLLTLLTGAACCLFGSYFGLLVLIPIFMSTGEKNISKMGKIEKDYIFSLFRSGIILYIIGALFTIISFATADDNGTYTIWYGAVIWGLIKIIQGIYYQSHPDRALKKINSYYDKNKQYPNERKFFQVSPGFKKFLVYFSIICLAVFIIVIIAGL